MDGENQEIYINLDDSGKLSTKEHISVYGGLVFLSKKEKDKFITQYKYIINDIKCSYCKMGKTCNNKCPEIKNTNILAKDKRRIMNYIKKYFIVAVVIKNDFVYNHIKENKAAKGRFIDYSIRRLIKEIVGHLIKIKQINPQKAIKIIINIDEQTTKSNGYYNLRDGLIEELKYGIVNYNYAAIIKPIVYSDLKIQLFYRNSSKHYAIQAADLLAGTIRREAINCHKDNLESLSKFIDLFLILP